MKVKSARIHFVVDGNTIFDEKFDDCDVSYSADFDIKKIFLPGKFEPADLKYTGKRNISLSVKTFEQEVK